ncbi:hypothetical protein KQX54_016655 [Cotesia glomerata]|uniref:Uncharacterized protein n=1 Tax=Cotesia glomerata TaxID=32391 RepID=A0AAV7HYS1_COTGL|nr:hypothetical protein KQX54_016655 [Cotesia glomerata]
MEIKLAIQLEMLKHEILEALNAEKKTRTNSQDLVVPQKQSLLSEATQSSEISPLDPWEDADEHFEAESFKRRFRGPEQQNEKEANKKIPRRKARKSKSNDDLRKREIKANKKQGVHWQEEAVKSRSGRKLRIGEMGCKKITRPVCETPGRIFFKKTRAEDLIKREGAAQNSGQQFRVENPGGTREGNFIKSPLLSLVQWQALTRRRNGRKEFCWREIRWWCCRKRLDHQRKEEDARKKTKKVTTSHMREVNEASGTGEENIYILGDMNARTKTRKQAQLLTCWRMILPLPENPKDKMLNSEGKLFEDLGGSWVSSIN